MPDPTLDPGRELAVVDEEGAELAEGLRYTLPEAAVVF